MEAHNEQEQQKAQQAALEAQAQVLILRKHGIENTFKAKDGQRSKFFFFFFQESFVMGLSGRISLFCSISLNSIETNSLNPLSCSIGTPAVDKSCDTTW